MSTVRRPVAAARVRRTDNWPAIKLAIWIGVLAVGVLMLILFGFPLIEDLIKGVDPAARYKPATEKEFVVQTEKSEKQSYEVKEMYLTEFKTKNDPYIYGNDIIFTTRVKKTSTFELDAVAIYNTTTEAVEVLPNVEKKYDNLLSPVMSDGVAVWVDSMTDGGGRIVGYDLSKQKQFTIKEYGYAIPQLSLDGSLLTFMQWAGDDVQRLYVYDVGTREAATVKLYETTTGNSSSDVSQTDLVWSEYRTDELGVHGALKRIVFDSAGAKYDNYDFGMDVFEPKTNGKDIVFSTKQDTRSGELMLSSGGSEPIKIAEGVLNYDIGDGFVAYTKEDRVFVCFTNRQEILELTSDITKNLLVSVNGKGLTFYDITDGVLSDEVVMYAYVE